MDDSIVMVFLTVPAEARTEALRALSEIGVDGFPGAVTSAAASFVESERTQTEDTELILVSARAQVPPTPALAEDLWRAVESALFRDGVSAVEHMVAYAVPGTA